MLPNSHRYVLLPGLYLLFAACLTFAVISCAPLHKDGTKPTVAEQAHHVITTAQDVNANVPSPYQTPIALILSAANSLVSIWLVRKNGNGSTLGKALRTKTTLPNPPH